MVVETGWIDDLPAFVDLREQWDALVPPGHPFLRHGWFVAWHRAFAGDGRLAALVAREGGELVGALPAVRRGGVLEAMANVHTPWFRPLATTEDVAAVLRDTFVRAAPGALHVDALPAGHEVDALVAALRRHGRLPVVEQRHVSPIVTVADGREDWWKDVKRGLAETARRRRKLHREHEVEERTLAEPDDLDGLLDEGFRLEAAGWKGRRGSAMLSDPRTAGFYRDIAHAFAEAGVLRLSTLRVDGRLAAFDLAVLDGGSYHLVKTAYDESQRNLAPGMVLRLAVVDRCFELAVDHDFLGDDMPYKRTFSNAARRHEAVRGFRRQPVGLARWAWRRELRPRLRSFRHRLRR